MSEGKGQSVRQTDRQTHREGRIQHAHVLHTYRCCHICRGFVVRGRKHRDDRDQNALNGVDRQPALAALLVAPFVLSRRVQDADADIAVFVHCGADKEVTVWVGEWLGCSDWLCPGVIEADAHRWDGTWVT